MKKSVLRAVPAALLLVLSLTMLAGCGPDRDEISYGRELDTGDSKAKIIELLGDPQYRETGGGGEVLQYCNTGFDLDVYRAFWVRDSRIIATKNYDRSGQIGLCSRFFQKLTWDDRPESRAEKTARLETGENATCVGYGLKHGTPAYADCRLRLVQMREQKDAAKQEATQAQQREARARQERRWQAFQEEQERNRERREQQQQQQQQPTNTNCQVIGNQIYCQSY